MCINRQFEKSAGGEAVCGFFLAKGAEMMQKILNLIGLVGQSCAGKNMVADFLEEKGYAVIDADKVAHTVLQEQCEAVIARFSPHAAKRGLQLRTQEGALNRKALSVLLFSEPALLAEHEAFILPKIEERIRFLIKDALTECPNRPIVLNAPTLHKTSLTPECSFILYIKAPFFIRLIRGRKRDNIPLCRLIARFLQQKDFFAQYLLQNADIVSVVNAHSVQSLRKKSSAYCAKRVFEGSYGTKENFMGYPFGKLIRIDYFRYCTIFIFTVAK